MSIKYIMCPTCVNCADSKPLYYLTCICAFSFVVDLTSTFIALTVWPHIFSELNQFFVCMMDHMGMLSAFMFAGIGKLIFLYLLYYTIFPKIFKYMSIAAFLFWSSLACINNIYLMITVV